MNKNIQFKIIQTLIETFFPFAVILIFPVQDGLSSPQSAALYPLTVVFGGIL